MRKLIPILLLCTSCTFSDEKKTPEQTLPETPSATQTAPTSTTVSDNQRPSALDSAVRGYTLTDYNVIDSFSNRKQERILPTTKPFVRASFKFDAEKVFYNTGVKTTAFSAVIAGFNTGVYQLKDAPMDGIVVRLIPQNGYWFIQANVASGYIKERMTVDVLFIRNDQVETIEP